MFQKVYKLNAYFFKKILKGLLVSIGEILKYFN